MTAHNFPNIFRREVLDFSLCYRCQLSIPKDYYLFEIVSDSCALTQDKKKQYKIWVGLVAVNVDLDRIRSHPVPGHCCLRWLPCVSYTIMWFSYCYTCGNLVVESEFPWNRCAVNVYFLFARIGKKDTSWNNYLKKSNHAIKRKLYNGLLY